MKKVYKFLKLQFSHIGNFIDWLVLFVTRENFKCYIEHDENKRDRELRIIVNGPSLRSQNFEILEDNVDYCMVNDACQTQTFIKIKPSSYVIADPGYITRLDLEENIKTWNVLNNVSWEMTLFIPYSMNKKVKNLLHNETVKISCYHSAYFYGWQKFSFFLYKKNLAMPSAVNVLIPSIYVGIQRGYSKIRLYGSDHSWLEQLRVNAANQVCVRQLHYYDNEELLKLEPWHDETGKLFSMNRILARFSEIFRQYEILDMYAKFMDVQIVNMCPNSYIDAFTKNE